MEERKRLRRSKKDRVFLGVLGGIAEYFGVDSTLLRLAFILFFVFYPGPMFLAYLLAALVMPEESEEKEEKTEERLNNLVEDLKESIGEKREVNRELVALLLILLGAILLAKAWVPIAIDPGTALAVALILIGAVLLLRGE